MRQWRRLWQNRQPASQERVPDLPVRDGCHVAPLVDGHAAMLAMCRAFLGAKRYILLAGWDIRADLPLVRGSDVHASPSGTPDQHALYNTLLAAGFDESALAFWAAGNLRVVDVLGFAASRGVKVGVLLWDAFQLKSHLTNDPAAERKALEAVGVTVLLDDSSRKIRHITQSLHQKCAVVDDHIAFVGGVDLTAQLGGDYDRWDTHGHPCASSIRASHAASPAHPWHDVHTQLTGPIVADVKHNIVQRWGDVAKRQRSATWPVELPAHTPPAVADGIRAQIVRTIPPHTYSFAPKGIATILGAYLDMIQGARSAIYLETQYLWTDIFLGLDDMLWAGKSQQMIQLLDTLAAALRRGVDVALVVPDHPNCGRKFTDGGIDWLRTRARETPSNGAFDVFCLGNSEASRTQAGVVSYRPVYVHAKVCIIDDTWWTAGSANLNSRGMHSDAEMNVSVFDSATAKTLRLQLWTEHLHPTSQERVSLDDPGKGIAILRSRAQVNLQHVREGSPLQGHLLPYITHSEARQLGVAVHPEHGWLDTLTTGAGETPEKYAGRYL